MSTATAFAPTQEFTTALRIRHDLTTAIEDILAHIGQEVPRAEAAARVLGAVRNQAQLAHDLLSSVGLTDATVNDLGTGSSRELAYVILRIHSLAETAHGDAKSAVSVLTEIRGEGYRALAGQRGA